MFKVSSAVIQPVHGQEAQEFASNPPERHTTVPYALTKDALFSIPSLPSSGQSANYLSNVGEIENKGIELSIGLQLVDTKDWNVRLNASYNTNHNKVLSIGNAVPFAIGGFSSRTVQTGGSQFQELPPPSSVVIRPY